MEISSVTNKNLQNVKQVQLLLNHCYYLSNKLFKYNMIGNQGSINVRNYFKLNEFLQIFLSLWYKSLSS